MAILWVCGNGISLKMGQKQTFTHKTKNQTNNLTFLYWKQQLERKGNSCIAWGPWESVLARLTWRAAFADIRHGSLTHCQRMSAITSSRTCTHTHLLLACLLSVFKQRNCPTFFARNTLPAENRGAAGARSTQALFSGHCNAWGAPSSHTLYP